MEIEYESLISSYLKDHVGLNNQFLHKNLAAKLKENLLVLVKDKLMKEAGIGNKSRFQNEKLIRSDLIYWLDRSHNNLEENEFLDLVDDFVLYLNRTCYSGITSHEFHYAYYDEGSFYKRHLDQFKDNQTRAFSMILYLNEDWQESDGGQLCIYHDTYVQTISPLNGSCVFFKSSELEHEVLLNFKPRMSITGWLKTN